MAGFPGQEGWKEKGWLDLVAASLVKHEVRTVFRLRQALKEKQQLFGGQALPTVLNGIARRLLTPHCAKQTLLVWPNEDMGL